MAFLAPESDGTLAARALEGAISSPVAVRLAITFTSETVRGAPSLATLGNAVPASLPNFSDTIQGVPGIERMEPHPEGKSIYLSTVTRSEGRATETSLPI